ADTSELQRPHPVARVATALRTGERGGQVRHQSAGRQARAVAAALSRGAILNRPIGLGSNQNASQRFPPNPGQAGTDAGKSGYIYAWEFLAAPGKIAEFRRVYGGQGDWVKLFRRSAGYIRSELYQDQANPQRFITVDHWESEAAWRAFREKFRHE